MSPAAWAPPTEREPAAADSTAGAPACLAGRDAARPPYAPEPRAVGCREVFAQRLPNAGLSRPITLMVFPHTFTGTCTGT